MQRLLLILFPVLSWCISDFGLQRAACVTNKLTVCHVGFCTTAFWVSPCHWKISREMNAVTEAQNNADISELLGRLFTVVLYTLFFNLPTAKRNLCDWYLSCFLPLLSVRRWSFWAGMFWCFARMDGFDLSEIRFLVAPVRGSSHLSCAVLAGVSHAGDSMHYYPALSLRWQALITPAVVVCFWASDPALGCSCSWAEETSAPGVRRGAESAECWGRKAHGGVSCCWGGPGPKQQSPELSAEPWARQRCSLHCAELVGTARAHTAGSALAAPQMSLCSHLCFWGSQSRDTGIS